MKIISRKEAIEQGLTRYFTGKPCPQGHVAERYTRKSGCVQCDSEGQKHRILVKKGMAEPKPKPVNLRKQATIGVNGIILLANPVQEVTLASVMSPVGVSSAGLHTERPSTKDTRIEYWNTLGKTNTNTGKKEKNMT